MNGTYVQKAAEKYLSSDRETVQFFNFFRFAFEFMIREFIMLEIVVWKNWTIYFINKVNLIWSNKIYMRITVKFR